MTSYRFRRRAFLAASGGLGLKLMLRNLETAAQTAKSPPRFLLTHWPLGIVAGSRDALWQPTSGSVTGSPGLQPFADAGMDGDMTVFRGISTAHLSSGGCGGAQEGGQPKLTTGVDLVPGCRASDSEGDDGVAGGPSIDQMLLRNVPALQSPLGGPGFANAICDSRVDTGEIGDRCLSYGYAKEPVLDDQLQTIMQNHPNMPTLSPLVLYSQLFASFAPTGDSGAGTGNAALAKQLALRKSVLDFALEEIDQMGAMAPSIAKNRLDTQASAIRDMERSLGTAAQSLGPPGAGCSLPPKPDASLVGQSGSPGNMYTRGADEASTDDIPTIEAVAQAHMDILRAAMVCDIIRVGTFQFFPGTNHVGLKGLYPGDPNLICQLSPCSNRIGTAQTVDSATVAGLIPDAGFLFNAQVWMFGMHAANLLKWKSQIDAFGNSLLDYTVVPFITEVRDTGDEQTIIPAMIIGGKRLGFLHSRYLQGNWTVNQYFGTIGQAFGFTNQEAVGAPIAGTWTMPS